MEASYDIARETLVISKANSFKYPIEKGLTKSKSLSKAIANEFHEAEKDGLECVLEDQTKQFDNALNINLEEKSNSENMSYQTQALSLFFQLQSNGAIHYTKSATIGNRVLSQNSINMNIRTDAAGRQHYELPEALLPEMRCMLLAILATRVFVPLYSGDWVNGVLGMGDDLLESDGYGHHQKLEGFLRNKEAM